jgi:hypothetical protein
MEGSSVNVKGLIYLALNFLASVGVVFSNKLVFRYYEFTYGMVSCCYKRTLPLQENAKKKKKEEGSHSLF